MITSVRSAVSVISATSCVLLTLLYLQSFGTADRVYGHLWGSTGLMLAWQEGQFAAVTFDCNGAHIPWRWESMNYPVDDDGSYPMGAMHTYPTHSGFGWIARLMVLPDLGIERQVRLDEATFRSTGPIVPFWCLVILTGSVSIVPWIRSRFRFRSSSTSIALVAEALGLLVQMAK